jgi:hypothetical protein
MKGDTRPHHCRRETTMNTKTKFAAALAALTLAASVALPASEAQAKPKWGAVGLGLIGTAIVAGAVANAYAEPVYVDGYRSCAWQARYDVFGNFLGNVQVCRTY